MARLVDAAGVDAVLVGDSLGMVVQGHDSTLPVTLEHMVYHCAAVRRGLARASGRPHLVGDLPFGSYQASADEAVKSAMRLAAEGGVEAVKLEGGAEYVDVIRRITSARSSCRSCASNGSRRRRIAQGSGTRLQDVNQIVKQFGELQKMMKQLSGGRVPRHIPGMPGMR